MAVPRFYLSYGDARCFNSSYYIASGNVVFASRISEARVKAALESALEAYAGQPVGVVVWKSSL